MLKLCRGGVPSDLEAVVWELSCEALKNIYFFPTTLKSLTAEVKKQHWATRGYGSREVCTKETFTALDCS